MRLQRPWRTMWIAGRAYHRGVPIEPRVDPTPQTISVVVPVYQGAATLRSLLSELSPLVQPFVTPAGWSAEVGEVLLVHDNGPDGSAAVMRELAEKYPFVRTIWLSRNYGQHPATLAGMASSGGDWIVTLDEDGQHDPAAIGALLDTALADGADVVYARPTNEPPHGPIRNRASRLAKSLVKASSRNAGAEDFHSFRLVLGEIGRAVAAYAGSGVYLDVALSWVARRVVTCPVQLRAEGGRPSGYSYRSLSSHFWRMVLTSGTRALRLVSLMGVLFASAGLLLALYFLLAQWIFRADTPAGWPSLMVVLLICSGAILLALGVIAEYLGVAVNMAMGRPLYLIVSDPGEGPLGRLTPAGAAQRHPAPAPAAPAPPVPPDRLETPADLRR